MVSPNLGENFPSTSHETSLETHLQFASLLLKQFHFLPCYYFTIYLIICVGAHMSAGSHWGQRERRSSGAGIPSSSEPPHVGAGNQTQVFRRAACYILNHWAISPDPKTLLMVRACVDPHHHTAVEIQGYLAESVLPHLCCPSLGCVFFHRNVVNLPDFTPSEKSDCPLSLES